MDVITPAPFFDIIALSQRYAGLKPMNHRVLTYQATCAHSAAFVDSKRGTLAVLLAMPFPEGNVFEVATLGLNAESLQKDMLGLVRLANLTLQKWRYELNIEKYRAHVLKGNEAGQRLCQLIHFKRTTELDTYFVYEG
jgi:hypothetical protein